MLERKVSIRPNKGPQSDLGAPFYFTSSLGQGYGGASSDYARTPPANISRPSQFTNPGSRDSRDISKTTSRELNNASWIWPAYKGGKRFRAEGLKGEDDRASSLSRVT